MGAMLQHIRKQLYVVIMMGISQTLMFLQRNSPHRPMGLKRRRLHGKGETNQIAALIPLQNRYREQTHLLLSWGAA
ncbi:hypothetical protein XENTR_v10023139 [Xenopus tropicalis]|nr:hypothetical protein XENTR_v10023139 [Xenopus tropicalis]